MEVHKVSIRIIGFPSFKMVETLFSDVFKYNFTYELEHNEPYLCSSMYKRNEMERLIGVYKTKT